jgi:hypothetical protein
VGQHPGEHAVQGRFVSEIAPRHYATVAGLVRRTKGDLSAEALERQSFGRAILADRVQPKPRQPSLVPTADGIMAELLLTIPAYASEDAANPLGVVYRDLLQQLPKTLAITVMTHERVARTVEQWLADAGYPDAALVEVPDHLHFSIWAEDGYVIVSDGASAKRYFVEPYEFPRYGDALIAEFVSHATPLDTTQAPLYFQGGNVLIGDDFYFIGADYPANSLRYVNSVIIPNAGEQPAAVVRRLYTEYLDAKRTLHYIGSTIPVPEERQRQIQIGGQRWTEYLYLGNRPGTVQPLFHIDMFITLAGRDSAGRYRVFVGDPSMAARTLGVPLWPHAMQEVFDNIATYLKNSGFAVHRNPLPLVYVDDTTTRERFWYFATANNALVQITKTTKDVWLPSYGFGNWTSLKGTDDENKQIWETLGFTVHMLGDFHPFAENLGAVHCIKKYLARG